MDRLEKLDIAIKSDPRSGKSGRRRGPTVHGTVNAYRYHNCRCDVCTKFRAKLNLHFRNLRKSRKVISEVIWP